MDSKILSGIILFILLTGLSGCNQPADPVQPPTPEPTETSELTPQPTARSEEEPEAPLETKARILVIGEPALDTIELLESSSDILEFEIVKQESLDNNSKNKFESIDLILLDQSDSDKKELSFRSGGEIAEWVWNGGKIIVVQNSGTFNPEYETVVGWAFNFGSYIVPVECSMTENNEASCMSPRDLNALIRKSTVNHMILKDFKISEETIALTVFPVAPRGTEIVTVKDSQSEKSFPGIVEKSMDKGRSIYFNFSPGKTPRLFRNTIRYLMG